MNCLRYFLGSTFAPRIFFQEFFDTTSILVIFMLVFIVAHLFGTIVFVVVEVVLGVFFPLFVASYLKHLTLILLNLSK